jgi:hypothetical protein
MAEDYMKLARGYPEEAAIAITNSQRVANLKERSLRAALAALANKKKPSKGAPPMLTCPGCGMVMRVTSRRRRRAAGSAGTPDAPNRTNS